MIDIRSSEPSIQNHLRRYYTLLDQGVEFKLSELFDSYRLMRPSLHKLIDSPQVDASALKYATDRLPMCIGDVRKIVIAQNRDQLASAGVDLSGWTEYSSPARRRQNFFHENSLSLVVLTNSDSDLDDLVNCLIAYQLETSKTTVRPEITLKGFPKIDSFYQKNAADWWQKIRFQSMLIDFESTPIYFVSSNFHSLTNLIGGFANQRQDFIISYIEKNHPDLYQQWQDLKSADYNQIRVIDFLYFLSGKYFSEVVSEKAAKVQYEDKLGFKTLKLKSQFPCDAQIIPISAIAKSSYLDPNLSVKDRDILLNSRGYIVNIEYPLGYAAYYLFKEVLATLKQLKSIYIIGKAAILNGEIGDVQVPEVMLDERSNNVFHPTNIFNDYFPFPSLQANILRHQKAIAVYGTFLENEAQLNNYIASGFNIVEMESGPILAAIHQSHSQLDSIPQNSVAYIKDLPYDLGIINYASDNPLTQTLGDSPLLLKGVEPTYLAALTVLQRIIDLESAT